MSVPVVLMLGLCAGAVLGATTRMGAVTRLGCALYGLAVVAPAGGILLVLCPDYGLMYVAHPRHGAVALAGVALAVGGPAVCVLGGWWGEAGVAGRWAPSLLGPFVGVGSMLGLGWRRTAWVGRYESFHGMDGGALPLIPLADSALFVPVVASLAVMTGVLVFTVLHLRRG